MTKNKLKSKTLAGYGKKLLHLRKYFLLRYTTGEGYRWSGFYSIAARCPGNRRKPSARKNRFRTLLRWN
jgi:hypothetical protein